MNKFGDTKKLAKDRYVNIDMGYGPAESWEKAKVIRSEMRKSLFSGEQEALLVERLGGERVWVDYWTESD